MAHIKRINSGNEIMECSGMRWHNAIKNTLRLMSNDANKVLNFRDDWRAAEDFAIERKLRFDFNGNIV